MTGFQGWWRYLPQRMDPVVFSIGGFQVQYYGLMYLAAFAVVYLLAARRIRSGENLDIGLPGLQELMISMIVGVIVGGRLGYVLFYNPAYYVHRPLEIVLPFSFAGGVRFTGIAGMSFHGGLIGVVIASLIYTRRRRMDFFSTADLIVPCIPLGYTFGRIGNFINGELYGRATDSGLGMYFPAAPGTHLRHPSQLYEAVFEGVVLFVLLWSIRRRIVIRGASLAFYLVLYGTVRFVIEFTREPDAHLGFVLGVLSMGQVLCLGMILAGGVLYLILRRRAMRTGSAGREA